MIIPSKLKPGDEIRIIAPSRSMSILSEDVKKIAQERLEQLGFKVSFGKNVNESNGTLITDEFLDFVEESKDFHIGMSLDGPEETHNRTRIYRNGSGSFNEVMNGLNLIRNRNRNIGGGVICVINAQNINNPKEIYEFFKSEKINVKFNPLIKSGRAEKNFKDLGITSKQYGDFLLQLWDIYNEDCKKEVSIDIDPFMDVIGNIETNKPMGCNYSESCRNSFISIGPQGDIYPCGRFDGIPEFWMGNVNKNTIEEALNSEIHQNLSKRNLESVTGCGGCDYGEICNSGCMHNAYFDGDIYGKDPYCGSYKQLFKKMKEVLNIEKEKAMEAVKNE